MPPKWTETATVTTSPTVTDTPAPTEPPTPTVAVTPLPDGIIARRPTEGELTSADSIWSGLKFAELFAPGVKRYSTSLSADANRLWDCYFCAKEAEFANFIDAIGVSFRVDGIVLPVDALRISEKPGVAGWRCRYWSTMLSHWPAGYTVSLEIKAVFKQEVNDGNAIFPPGDYRQAIGVLVEAK
jgi:hypothetical protein